MVKAITFDCWDTLLDDDISRTVKRKEFFRNVFQENGFPVTKEKMDEIFSREAKIFQDYIIKNRKTQNSRMRVETICQLAGVELPEREKERLAEYGDRVALEYRPPVVKGIKEVLEVLAGKYRMAVICNTGWHSGNTVRQLLEDYDFPRYFYHLTFSDEAGIAKPHKQIFEYTLEKIGYSPGEALHIGDSEYSDIVGAKEAGMKAILFTGINEKYKDKNTADVTIEDYERLVEIIENM